jgi:membrane associated rhomboid family serine protease
MIPPASPDTLSAMGRTSGRISRGFRQLRNAPATWQLFRIIAVAQTVPVIWNLVVPPGSNDPDKLFQAQIFLGLNKSYFLAGDFWQPLTYALIHGNWPHLIANAATIVLLGSKLEHIAGQRTFRLVALLAALAGGLLFLLLTPSGHPAPQTLVGSSAICFAFLVLLTTLSPESKFLPVFVSGKSLGIGIILANLFLALINPDLPTGPLARFGAGLSEGLFPGLFKISHACHLGGSLAGYVAGRYLLRPRVNLESLRRAREKRERMAPPKG